LLYGLYTARYFGAKKTTFGWCFLAIFTTGIIQSGIDQIFPNVWVNFLLGLIASGLLYAVILDTDVKTGFKIALVSTIIVVLVILLASTIIT